MLHVSLAFPGALALGVLFVLAAPGDGSPGGEGGAEAACAAPASEAPAEETLSGLAARPVAFVENRGQWDAPATYVARMGALAAFLEERGWIFTLVEPVQADGDESTLGRKNRDIEPPDQRGVAVRMRFLGSGEPPVQQPEGRLAGHHNYFLGNDPERWRTEVPLHASVLYRGMYPGIDVRVRETRRSLEYDLLLEPGAKLSSVVVSVEGIEGMRLAEDGSLVLDTALGPVLQGLPVSWQVDEHGEHHPIECRYVLLGRDCFGFEAPGRNRDWSLVVDPLLYSTYLGGTADEYPQGIAVDAAGQILVWGHTLSPNFPTTPGAFRDTFQGGDRDGFVTRIDPSLPTAQQLVYSTFLGGNDRDGVQAVKVDANGILHLAGFTRSGDPTTGFPTTPGTYQSVHGGMDDGFYTRLDPTGRVLLYSTFLGGEGVDVARDLQVDAAGVATLCGIAGLGINPPFPTTPNAYVRVHGGGSDGFVARIDPSQPTAQQHLVYSTLLGGNLDTDASRLRQDASGVVTVAGTTNSSLFNNRTPGTFQPVHQGGYDGFVCRLDPSLPPAQQLLWFTYFGGTLDEQLWALHVGPHGVTVTGQTLGGTSFPTTQGAYSERFNGGGTIGDGFVARLSLDGRQLLWSTYLGASANDQAIDLSVDLLGIPTVVGWTQSPGVFPTTPGAFRRARSMNEGFVVRLDASGSRLLYSTYLGGNGQHDGAWNLVADLTGIATITGATTGPNFPTTPGAFQPTFAGGSPLGYDAFVTQMHTVPRGTLRYGDVSRDCLGRKPTIHALHHARAGSTTFGLACSQAAPNAAGFLLFATQSVPGGMPVLGMQIYVDLATLVVPPFFLPTNWAGEAQVTLPIPAGTSGTLYTQMVIVDPSGCPATVVSATDALGISW